MSGVWWQLPADVAGRTDLTPAAKLVFACIVDAIGDNPDTWAGVRNLAERCGLGRSTVAEAVAQLEGAKLIVVERVVGNPGGKTNRYRLPERSENETCQNPDVPKSGHRTYQNPDAGRTEKRTEPDPCNQTHSTRPKKRAQADPWTAAQAAMEGDTLRTEPFRKAWGEWTEYRRQAGKRLTPATVQAQVSMLEELGHDVAIESIRTSIRNGWQGVFPPKGDARAKSSGPRLHEGIVTRRFAGLPVSAKAVRA